MAQTKYIAPTTKWKEFVEPTPEPSFIWWLFRNLCVSCKHPADEINEIIPRSRSKESVLDWTNRVTMCKNCHNEYHKNGVNAVTIHALQQKRINFLKDMGREEYLNPTLKYTGEIIY